MNAVASRKSIDTGGAAFVTTHWSLVCAAQGDSDDIEIRKWQNDEVQTNPAIPELDPSTSQTTGNSPPFQRWD